jgi:hypothetical protein
MNVHNIPQDKKQAETHLKGAKDELTDLYKEFAHLSAINNSVNTVLETIMGRIDIIDQMLEGADYEEAANLDHMTENQFNG